MSQVGLSLIYNSTGDHKLTSQVSFPHIAVNQEEYAIGLVNGT